MGNEFEGHVLRAPRVAPGNTATSIAPDNGVVRDVRPPPVTRTAAQPEIVDLAGDQYRAAVLEAPGTSPHEYLVWAANSSQLALVDNPAWFLTDGIGQIPIGTLTVGDFEDGTLQVIVSDNGDRSIGTILALVVALGDKTYDDEGWVDPEDPSLGRAGPAPFEIVLLAGPDQDGDAGLVTLTEGNVSTGDLVTAGVLAVFGGGLSLERGDFIVDVRYTIAPSRFWWTRNDRYETRFGWNDQRQKWEPFKGSAPVDLGPLLFDSTYILSPKIRSLPIGAFLPGDASVGDSYAMIRLGSSPGALSLGVGVNDPNAFIGIQVVPDGELEGGFDFSFAANSAGVVGQTSSVLEFNPSFVNIHAGKTIWYSYQGFSQEMDGIVGDLLEASTNPLFIAPVPGPTDYPFIKLGNRRHLTVIQVEDEADLEVAELPPEGSVIVALSTGRLLLSLADVAKSDPTNLTVFDKHFLGEQIIYDGVALNFVSQPTKGPVPLTQLDGVVTFIDPVLPLYVDRSKLFPEDVEGTPDEFFMGLGMSGVLQLPDGTGAVPDPEGVTPATIPIPVRAGGDEMPPPGGGPAPPQSLGLVRRINDGVSDLILFSRDGAVVELVPVDYNDELPLLPFEVPGGQALIARESTLLGSGGLGSQVQISSSDRQRFSGQEVFFLQAALTPAVHTTVAQIFSKSRIVFRFDGDEVLYFAIEGVAHDWHADTLLVQDFYNSIEVATSIQARITAQSGTGICRAVGDRVLLEASDITTGTVEIGWGDPKDLSGAAALGFLPGWRVIGGKPNWLVDAGISLGLNRSLVNMDRAKADADYKARGRFEDVVLQTVSQTPFVFFDFPPLQDVPGFDDGVFFNIQNVTIDGEDIRIVNRQLHHFKDIQHRFGERKFLWLDNHLETESVKVSTTTLALGRSNIVPESLLGAPGIGGGLFAATDGGVFEVQEQGVDYVLPEDGAVGVANLVTRFGPRVLFGAGGTFTEDGTTFEDLSTDALGNFITDFTATVQPGYRLKMVSGEAIGSYIVTAVTDGQHLEVQQQFPGTSARPTPWEIFSGISDDLFNPAIVADVTYEQFRHLPEETFKVRVLSPLGVAAPGTVNFTASVEDAVTRNRPVELRFGAVAPDSSVFASLTPLTLEQLGVIGNNLLVLPDTTHVTEGAFSILVGTQEFIEGIDLIAVTAFSADPAGVEYLTADWTDADRVLHPKGELKFGQTVLVDLASSDVWFVQELRASSDLVAGQAEFDPKTGEVRISDADAATHDGTTVYFVEQQITDERLDVAISPLVGAVSFRKPVNKGSLVEMEYHLADSEGRRVGGPDDFITEFLPVSVRREDMVRVAPDVFLLNADGSRVIDDRIEPLVHIGPIQQNFGADDFGVDFPLHLPGVLRVTFNRSMADHIAPIGSYFAFDANGGERAYNTSSSPVYRPPFFIKEAQDNFGLRSDRTGDFTIGQMLRIGAESFYITDLRYFPDSDVTRVDIFPSTVDEVGTRSPGNDVLTLITTVPITTLLDPDGETPIPTTAKAGFMQEIPLTDFPFEPVNAKQNSITFLGNLTPFAVPGHIMEIAGIPFTITQAELNEDGTRTRIIFSSIFKLAIDPAGDPTVKLSFRPVYPPGVRDFVGVGPLLFDEGVELVLYGEKEGGVELPGRSLAQGTEFEIDSEAGVVRLLEPIQEPLGSGQRLILSFTRLRPLGPFFGGGVVTFPRWTASFLYNTLPDVGNGLLGGTLTATYSFANPDTFYFRALPLRSFLGEAVEEALSEIQASSGSNGPLLAVPPGRENWEQGNLGLLAQRRHLVDKDRAARTLLSFFNTTIESFEQVTETISGSFIGDRDGKFRFFVGRGKEYAPPGYEDSITGVLNPNNVWVQVFNAEDPDRDITFNVVRDSLAVPATARMPTVVPPIIEHSILGALLNPFELAELMKSQTLLVLNDVDDVVLIGPERPSLIPKSTFPYFDFQMKGIFARMGSLHRFSRIFPAQARVFFTLMPGILGNAFTGDPGVYSAGRVNPATGLLESTTGTTIGQVSNPVLGEIGGLQEKTLRPRLARARIFGYFPEGIPAGAFAAGTSPVITKPSLVVSMIPLGDLPVDSGTGFPNETEFLSLGGTIPDAVSGHPENALPGFLSDDQIAWGQPDGNTYTAFFGEEVDILGTIILSGVFVDEVLFGCVLTFKDRSGAPITDQSLLLVGTAPDAGTPADKFPIERADTIFVVPPDALEVPITDPATDSLTVEDLTNGAENTPEFRIGFDVQIKASGEVVDITQPSFEDPAFFPLKEMNGQRPPDPGSHVEGQVDFLYEPQVPLAIPALTGEALDDSGDIQIPYMKTTSTELDRFDEIQGAIGGVMETDPTEGALNPDEILISESGFDPNGFIVTNIATWFGGPYFREPATIVTTADVFPTPDLGVEPGRVGDILLLEVERPVGLGWQGISTAGALRSAVTPSGLRSWIEPPRFVTQSNKGSRIRYELNNYAVHTTPGNYGAFPQTTNPPGIRLIDDIANSQTILSFQDVVYALNDSVASGVGNLNTIVAASASNVVQVDLISRPDDQYINAPAGPFSVNDSKDNRVLLTFLITSGTLEVIDFQGNTTGALAHTGVTFGTFDPVTGETVPGPVADERHIIMTGLTGAIPFTPAVGTESEWFLPHVHSDPAGPTDRKISIYGWEFAVSIDTYAGGGALPGPGSTSAFIGSDRLTFHESVDMRIARPREFQHTIFPNHQYPTSLRVREIVVDFVAVPALSTVNDVNGGVALTMLSREEVASPISTHTSIQGTWSPAASPAEDGTFRVMAFEGDSNLSFGAIGVGSVVASNSAQVGGDILNGSGTAVMNCITAITAVGGDESNVQKGDIVYIDQADAVGDIATEKAGSYIVRHAVKPDVGFLFKTAAFVVSAGTGLGFIKTPFPKVVAFSGNSLTLDDTTALPATGRVFVFQNPADLSSTVAAEFKEALFSAEWTTLFGNVLTLDGASFKWADDTAVASPGLELFEGLAVGTRIGWHDNSVLGRGITTLTVDVRNNTLPDDSSVVGHVQLTGVGTERAVFGFAALTFENLGGVLVEITAPPPGEDIVVGLPVVGSGNVGITAAPVHANETLDPTGEAVVYEDVPDTMLIALDDAQGVFLNNPVGHASGSGVSVVLPGTEIRTETALGANGFFAVGGVFLEPSVPHMPYDLTPAGDPHIVDRDHSLLASEVGMRNSSVPETVLFDVRRVRRWHGAQNALNDAFMPLQFAYEIRRGIVTGFTVNEQQYGTVEALEFEMDWNALNPTKPFAPDVWNENNGIEYDGTNLGGFDDENVNINPGDLFRLIDDNGVLLEEAVVSQALSSSELQLAPPGIMTLPAAGVVGVRFEVWLKRAPVPHEQSNEQLLERVIDKEVHQTIADYSDPDPTLWTGGFVPETDGTSAWADVSNRLFDDETLTGVGDNTFVKAGVRVGDIVIIDPAGTLPVVNQKGARPFGDRGVFGRVAIPPGKGHEVFQASGLDDNRGFYRVTVVKDDHVEVSGVTEWSGENGSDVILAASRPALSYTIYPTIGVSLLSTDGTEGQQDLRPTLKAVTGDFTLYPGPDGPVHNKHSISPVSYRIIRPTTLFSTEVVDTVLMVRERMLSLIELFRGPMSGERGGFYYDWQAETHAYDLGEKGDPDSGRGLFPNRLITSLVGELGTSPFLNTTDCLSLHDRRFWILDRRLDGLRPDGDFATQLALGGPAFPTQDGPYTAYLDTASGGSEVRPVLPDHIDLILNVRDRLRDTRFVWLSYRTHRLIGTLSRIEQFDETLPARIEERERSLILEATADGVET